MSWEWNTCPICFYDLEWDGYLYCPNGCDTELPYEDDYPDELDKEEELYYELYGPLTDE